jgi:phosphatidate cytidylyltransferase
MAQAETTLKLRQRLIISLLIVPPGLLCIIWGGIFYYIVMLGIVGLAAYEYVDMLQKSGARPARVLTIGGAILLAVVQSLNVILPSLNQYGALASGITVVLLIVVTLLWHVRDFERGAPNAGTDWAVTIGGILYMGWMCSYFIPLRMGLRDGMGWTLVVLPAIWLSDTGAYVAGRAWGRHPMAPRLSPKKTWEGFVGGLVGGMFFGALFAGLLSLRSDPTSSLGFFSGAVVGFMAALGGVLGDLSISMFKRQVGIKDTSNLLGAHGGLLDRIDSWLIGGPIAYFVIMLFFK